MKTAGWIAAVALLAGVSSAQAQLTTVFSEDFTNLSDWDLNRLGAGTTVTAIGGQGVFNASTTTRGMPTVNLWIPDHATLAALAGPGGVALSVSLDVVSSTHFAAGGLLIGVPQYVDGSEPIIGTLLYDGLAGDGGNQYVIHWDNPAAVWTSSGSAVWEPYPNVFNFGGAYYIQPGDRVRVDFLTSDGVGVDMMKTYVDGGSGYQLGDTLLASEAPVAFQAGQIGFYLNNNRDFTIDNFVIQIAVPEPASLVLLGAGGILALVRRRLAS